MWCEILQDLPKAGCLTRTCSLSSCMCPKMQPVTDETYRIRSETKFHTFPDERTHVPMLHIFQLHDKDTVCVLLVWHVGIYLYHLVLMCFNF